MQSPICFLQYEGAGEFASYLIRLDGLADISFANNMPDALYSELLAKLQKHPDINGLIAGKGGLFIERHLYSLSQ